MVYGPTLDRASHLRSFKGGLISRQKFYWKNYELLKIFLIYAKL
jgi:hypothetical protein